MKIPGKKRDYFDQEIYYLVSLIETSEFIPIKKVEYVLDEDDDSVLDLSDKIKGSFTSSERINSNVISIKRCEDLICRELKDNNYTRYIKFIDTIYKSTEINQVVSRKFILDLVFDYIIDAHKQKKTEGNFSDYLLDKITDMINEYKVYFSIHNLEIIQPLSIGKVQFALLERNLVVENQERQDTESVKRFYKKYGKQLFASYIVKAEKEKAVELAFSECSLAIDVLKICSDTMDNPLLKISFDIDSRVSEILSAETLIKNTAKVNDLTISIHRIPNYHQINDAYKKRLIHRNLNFFNGFLLRLPTERNELQKILINAIRRFAKALSTNNLNQRVMELFTIMESLVVPNENSNIIESLTRYSSKLVHKEREDRINLIKIIKRMYEVRSSYVHHAKEIDFDIDDLMSLQHSVQALIGKFIEKSREYQDKMSVLKEIDDAILDAY